MTCWLVSLCLSCTWTTNQSNSQRSHMRWQWRQRVNKTAPLTLMITDAYTKLLSDQEVNASISVHTLSDNTEAFVMTTAEHDHRRPHSNMQWLCRRVHVQKCCFHWFLLYNFPACPRLFKSGFKALWRLYRRGFLQKAGGLAQRLAEVVLSGPSSFLQFFFQLLWSWPLFIIFYKYDWCLGRARNCQASGRPIAQCK